MGIGVEWRGKVCKRVCVCMKERRWRGWVWERGIVDAFMEKNNNHETRQCCSEQQQCGGQGSWAYIIHHENLAEAEKAVKYIILRDNKRLIQFRRTMEFCGSIQGKRQLFYNMCLWACGGKDASVLYLPSSFLPRFMRDEVCIACQKTKQKNKKQTHTHPSSCKNQQWRTPVLLLC